MSLYFVGAACFGFRSFCRRSAQGNGNRDLFAGTGTAADVGRRKSGP